MYISIDVAVSDVLPNIPTDEILDYLQSSLTQQEKEQFITELNDIGYDTTDVLTCLADTLDRYGTQAFIQHFKKELEKVNPLKASYLE